MTRSIRPFLTLGLLAASVLGSAALGLSQESGTVTLETKSIAAGIGISWGEGTLTLRNGQTFKFSVDGLSVGQAGVSSIKAVGKVYDLKRVEDFAGNYVLAQAGIAVGGGASGVTMRNQHGVVMNLQAVEQGINFTLGSGGLRVTLKN